MYKMDWKVRKNGRKERKEEKVRSDGISEL